MAPTLKLVPPPRAPLPPDEQHGMTFDVWVEQNAERIWTLMRVGDVRDRSFNDVAETLWGQL